MPEPWPTLLAFILSLSLLYRVQRWITQHMQGIGMLLFGSYDAGMAVLWFFLLPGIILHELSHWLMAKLLGLKTGRFRFWPELRGRELVLATVEVQRSNPLSDSLVGLAPFLGGTLVLLGVGYLTFDAGTLGLAWEQADWSQVLELLAATVQVADSWIWLYLMVAISNAMMPSPSDATSWRLVLIYMALGSSILLLLGWWPALPAGLVTQIAGGLRTVTYAFSLTLIIDLIFVLMVWLVELALGIMRGRRVVYK